MTCRTRPVALAAAALTSLSFASSAPAFNFAPAATMFTGSGSATLVAASGVSITCSARYRLKTNPAGTKLKITSALFFGSSACTAVSAMALPWVTLPTSLSTVNIQAMSLTVSGPCGPGNVPANLSSSVMTFSAPLNPGGCMVSGNINISPTLTIF